MNFRARMRAAPLKRRWRHNVWPELNRSRFSRGLMNKPVRGQLRHSLQSAGFLEEMCRARDNLHLYVTTHLRFRLFIQTDYDIVFAADDQQSRRSHERQCLTSQIRSASA